MTKRAIHSDSISPAFGHYSSAVLKHDTLYLAGQGPFDKEKKLVGDDIVTQTHQTMKNIRSLLEDNGFQMDDIVRSTVFLADITHWAAFNEVYGQYFSAPYPARTVEIGGAWCREGVEVVG